MAYEKRLAGLVERLLSHEGYAEGTRPFPERIGPEDAADIVTELHRQVDEALAERAAKAKEAGKKIACQQGCTACCEELVMVSSVEALVVAFYLLEPENSAVRRGFLARYPAWRKAMGAAADDLGAAVRRRDREGYMRVYLQAFDENRALCALNSEGACTVYSARPILCRQAHALDNADLCGPHHPALGERREFAYAPAERVIDEARRLNWAVHHAVGGQPDTRVALCDFVYEMVKDYDADVAKATPHGE